MTASHTPRDRARDVSVIPWHGAEWKGRPPRAGSTATTGGPFTTRLFGAAPTPPGVPVAIPVLANDTDAGGVFVGLGRVRPGRPHPRPPLHNGEGVTAARCFLAVSDLPGFAVLLPLSVSERG